MIIGTQVAVKCFDRLTHSSSSTPSNESCGSGSSMFPSLATMALSSCVT